MKLRLKALIITCVTFAVFSLLAYPFVYSLMFRNFSEQENARVEGLVKDAQSRLQGEIVGLDRILGGWSSWDDTYRFMQEGDGAYVESNLQDYTFLLEHFNFIGYYDPAGRPVLVKAVDFGTGRQAMAPRELLGLSPAHPLLAQAGEAGPVRGLMLLGGRLAIVDSHPVLTSKGEGPSMGTMVMGRYLGREDVLGLAGARSTTTRMWVAGEAMPQDVSEAWEAAGNGTAARALGEELVAGYFVASDVRGLPVAIFRVESPRPDYAEFSGNAFYLAVAMVGTAAACAAASFLLMDWSILRRLRRLGLQAGLVGADGNGSISQEPDGGDDEISQLTGDIGQMLSRLHSTRQQLLRSQQRYSQRLEGEVKEKTRQLEAANAKLLRMERTKNEFLFSVGHELKSPLAVIEMNLEIGRSRLLGNNEREESRRMIERSVRKLKDKIEELIQLSRFEYGRIVDKKPLDFSDVVRRVADTYRDFADVRKVKIHLAGTVRRKMVVGDQRLLQYAIGNLFSNAVKYCRDRDIYARLAREGGSVVFSIENSGESIRPENRKKLFRKFFKEDPNSPGTGVGLFITKEIAKSHHGRVWYTPRQPSGSIFHFSLPAGRADAEREAR